MCISLLLFKVCFWRRRKKTITRNYWTKQSWKISTHLYIKYIRWWPRSNTSMRSNFRHSSTMCLTPTTFTVTANLHWIIRQHPFFTLCTYISKVVPYSITSVELRTDTGFLAVDQLADDLVINHRDHPLMAGTKLYCSVTEVHRCK